ncbi:hypothetical protein BGZ76_003740, partial [Entomortierella beljakovae]
LQIEISGIPAENGKCRVETQLKIALQLKDAQGHVVTDWKQLRLPHPLIAKEKHRMEKFNARNKHAQDAEILTLDARLVCDHDMTKILECCENCIGRERKRAHRRKESQKLPGQSSTTPVFGSINAKTDSSSIDEESVPPTPTDPIEYEAWEKSRIMVFSSTEYVDLSSGQCLLPTRITCYCRHHNEKVGFRIQFTAKDSSGVVLATVLTNPVMMMDDHKSGKRTNPTLSKSTGESRLSTKKKLSTESEVTATPVHSKTANRAQSHDYDDDDHDMEQDEGFIENPDEIDLEAGHHKPRHPYSANSLKFKDSEILSGDILSPLGSSMDRIGSKRRVNEDSMEGIQTNSLTDPLRGPFRRKTSHDTASNLAGSSSLFSSRSQGYPPTSTASSQSPFTLGSPFAMDARNSNTFPSSLTQALVSGGSFLDQKNIDMFLQSGLVPVTTRGEVGHNHVHKDLHDHECSMMEFTTLDESMSSPHDSADTFSTSTSIGDTNVEKTSQPQNQVPFSLSPTNFSTSTAPVSNPFSTAGMFASAFSTTFSSPLNGTLTTTPMFNAPDMSSSFLDASQMQEFQKFKSQSEHQQEQQQVILKQLQQGLQQNQQKSIESKPVPWLASSSTENKDPFNFMKLAMSQTTDPTSSAFIPTHTSLSEGNSSDAAPKSTTDISGSEGQPSTFDTTLAPKKRGRPRKAAPSTSEAESPIESPRLFSFPPSPSPPPATIPSAASTAAAAQYLLFQQRHQQQLQHHQQQLQQQQKQAILARQKPRVQKLIPSRGPVEGGSEITILGSGFYPGIIPIFDGVPATNVQYYGPETVICRLPPRSFPGTVIVKAHNSSNGSGSGAGLGVGGIAKDGADSSGLVRTMTQLFGGPPGINNSNFMDDDVGVFFEYEESNGDRDLIALALQVLGMKMNGRVEPPHQVAMRIMGTEAATSAIMGNGVGSSQGGQPQIQQAQPSLIQSQPHAQLQLQLLQQQQQQQQQQQLQQTQQSMVGLGGLQSNILQQNPFSQQQPHIQQPNPFQQLGQPRRQEQVTSQSVSTSNTSNTSIIDPGMLGSFSSFMNSMGGSSSGSL